jgi:hypothetical protein
MLRRTALGSSRRSEQRSAVGSPRVAVSVQYSLNLQQSIGNQATSRVVRRLAEPAGPQKIQRHGSWEHQAIGNASPESLGETVVDKKNRQHLLSQLYRQATFFQNDPTADPRKSFPDLKWIQLAGSKLWVSYGELNALPDIFANSKAIDSLPPESILPGLQRMRHGVAARALKMFAALPDVFPNLAQNAASDAVGPFSGEADASGLYKPIGKHEDVALDNGTASQGSDRYMSLVARNACHFAPESWERWAHFHNGARAEAKAFFDSGTGKAPLKDLDVGADKHEREAWLQNGYGEHFLQDSFAAGHLVNKTLVMQWFVDYINSLGSKWWDLLVIPLLLDNTKPWIGMPDAAIMDNMGSAQQPNMAGRHMYGHAPSGSETADEGSRFGWGPTDPATANERKTHEQRVQGSGVVGTGGASQEQNFDAYKEFLNTTYLQMAAGEAHDRFNAEGLSVSNVRGDTFNIGGDDTFLAKSGKVGIALPGEAQGMSRRAI